MADYGNHFTSNSGNYNYNTRGHSYDDSGWVIVSLANSGNVSKPIPHPNGAEFTDNDTTCYFYTNNHMTKPNREVKTGNDYVAYFNWATENANIMGSIFGDFNFYPFGSNTDSRFVEPTGLDDTKHGVSPYSNSNNNIIFRTNLTAKGTTYTAGYRRHKIQYEPSIKYDLASYNYGTNDNYKSDGKTKATGGRVVTSRYDAFQTFYNIKDPYSVLNVYISNHDDAKSSSPTFCSLTNNKSEYRISHSYAYNPYKNSAIWNNTNYLSFTYNTLPTYPKELVFAYSDNYKSVSYDGGTVNVEATAWYNNNYDRFTTSTANDDGFSSYKRYVDVTYELVTVSSTTKPTGSDTYTFRIWQPGSKLGISYAWSIDGNPTWAHLSTTSGNKTTVTFDDQGDDKPGVAGTLSLSLNSTSISNGGSTSGSVSGVDWTAPTNKGARSCVIRQNMTVTNCCAQNITPKTSSGQPYRAMTLIQNGMYWNNPSFNMKWKVTQGNKTTTTYNDGYRHGWPTVSIGSVETSDGTEKTTGWNYAGTSKSVSITMPTISRPWVNTYTNGTVTITKESDTAVSYKGGDVTINLHPDITFRQGFTSGVSERTWTISNTGNSATQQEYWSLKKFNDVTIKLPAISAANHTFGNATLSWRDTGTQTLTFSKSSKTWNNDNTDDNFTTSLASNLPYIGTWSASASDGTLTFTSTTKNSGATSGTITFSGTTYQDGTLTPSPSTITISQNGTNISGIITITGSGAGIDTCSKSATYPIDGNKTTGSYKLKGALQRYVTGAGTLNVSIYSPSGNIAVDGQTIYVSSSGSPSTDSEASKSQSWSISATSNIVSTNPSGGNPIISGTVKPLNPSYHYEYKLNDGSWQKSTSFTIGSNAGSVTSNTDATLTATTYTDVKDGIYKYERGYYHRNSTSEVTHNVYIRVVDDYDGNKVYEGGSDTKKQSRDPGGSDYSGGSWTITPDNDYNCVVSTTEIEYTGDKNTASETGIGSFSVTPDWYNSHSSYPIQNNSDEGKDFVSNYSDTTSRSSSDSGTASSVLFGEDHEFQPNETISQNYGVTSSSPDVITTTTSTSGSVTWKYKYKYSVAIKNGTWYFTKHDADGNYTPPSNTVTKLYYRCVNDNGSGWVRLRSDGKKTFTATSVGTFSVEIAWMTTDSNGNYIDDGRKGYDRRTITVSQLVETTWYRLKVTISTDENNKSSFASSGWTLTATVTAQSTTCVGKPGNDATWTDSTVPSNVTYSWTGATGTTKTASVDLSAVSAGTSKDTIGNEKEVSVSVSCNGYETGKSNTIKLGKYGITVDFAGTLSCSDDKTITAFDTQTYDTTASVTGYKVTAKSGTLEENWTSSYNNYTQNATSHTLTAVQGSDGSTTGDASYKYTFTCPVSSIPSGITVGTDASTSHTVHLYCYGKSYYNG